MSYSYKHARTIKRRDAKVLHQEIIIVLLGFALLIALAASL